MLTRRENALKVINGEMPDFVPVYITDFTIGCFSEFWPPKSPDQFGVNWVPDPAGHMVDPAQETLKDITRWRERVNLPSIDELDWDGLAAGLAARHDPGEKLLSFWVGTPVGGVFLPIMNMMGFEEGLIALMEEPEAVKEFVDYCTDYFVELIYALGERVRPDAIEWFDDICSQQSLFMSYSVYEELFKDSQYRIIGAINEVGAIPQMHCCGNCELVVDDFVNMGVKIWEPVQASLNDVKYYHKKYGTKLVYNGLWVVDQERAMPNTPEEDVRAAVRDCIDEYFGEGGMIFHAGSTFGTTEEAQQRFKWVYDEAEKYGHAFYKNLH